MTKARKRRETVESASDSNAFDIFDICVTIIHLNFLPNKLNDGKVNDGKGDTPFSHLLESLGVDPPLAEDNANALMLE